MRNPVIPLCNIAWLVSCWPHFHSVVAFFWLCPIPPADSAEDAVLLPRLSNRSPLFMQTSWFQLSIFLILMSDPPLQYLTVRDPYSCMFGSEWSRDIGGFREELREGLKWYKYSSYICDSATNKNVNGKKIWHRHCTWELTATMVTWTKPEQDLASPHFTMDERRSWGPIPPLVAIGS